MYCAHRHTVIATRKRDDKVAGLLHGLEDWNAVALQIQRADHRHQLMQKIRMLIEQFWQLRL